MIISNIYQQISTTYERIIVIQYVDIVLEVVRSNELIHYYVLVNKRVIHTRINKSLMDSFTNKKRKFLYVHEDISY